MPPIFETQTYMAQRQIVGGALITPRSQVIRLNVPIINLTLAWNRPRDVIVERVDRPAETIPVIDVTRIAQITFLLLGAAAAALLRRVYR